MTFQQELASWNPFGASHTTQAVPDLGEQARSAGPLKFPRADKKPAVIAFLRHCGCPCMRTSPPVYSPLLFPFSFFRLHLFPSPTTRQSTSTKTRRKRKIVAEKTLKKLKAAAEANPHIHFVAVSHSDTEATAHWLEGVGGAGAVEVMVDAEREVYGAYGLGVSSMWHALNPWSMASVVRLGRSEQIWNRPTESGSRWQTAGLFGVNDKGYLEYVHVARAADDLGELEEAIAELKR